MQRQLKEEDQKEEGRHLEWWLEDSLLAGFGKILIIQTGLCKDLSRSCTVKCKSRLARQNRVKYEYFI